MPKTLSDQEIQNFHVGESNKLMDEISEHHIFQNFDVNLSLEESSGKLKLFMVLTEIFIACFDNGQKTQTDS
jgi:hypothetical protein